MTSNTSDPKEMSAPSTVDRSYNKTSQVSDKDLEYARADDSSKRDKSIQAPESIKQNYSLSSPTRNDDDTSDSSNSSSPGTSSGTKQKLWLEKYKITLFNALGRFIEERNRVMLGLCSEGLDEEETIIGENVDLETPGSPFISRLYFFWCEVCALMSSKPGARISDDELPPGFRKLVRGRRNKEDMMELAASHLEEMDRSGVDSPWLRFSGRQLLDLLPSLIQEIHIGVPGTWEIRNKHHCIPGICKGYDRNMWKSVADLETSLEAAKESRKLLQLGKTQAAQSGLKAFEKETNDNLRRLKNCHTSTGRVTATSGEMQEAEKSQKSSRTLPVKLAKRESDWQQHLKGLDDMVIHQAGFEFFLILIACADPGTNYTGLRPPAGFKELWGQTNKQIDLHASDYEARLNQRKADMLSRSGFAPPFLHEYVFELQNRRARWEEINDFELHPGYRQADTEERRKMSDEITNQMMTFLFVHLSATPHSEAFKTDPSDPRKSWSKRFKHIQWDINQALSAAARKQSDFTPSHWHKPGKDGFWPLNVDKDLSSEEKQNISERWVRDVIVEQSDWVFNDGCWKLHLVDDFDFDYDDDDDDEQWAYQRLMKTKAVLNLQKGFTANVACLPAGFLTGDTEDRSEMALTLIEGEEKKRDELVTLALSHILADAGSYGTPAFRTPTSPVVVSAARKAFSEKGVDMFPLKGSPFCECEFEQDHLLLGTEALAHAICDQLDILDAENAVGCLSEDTEFLDIAEMKRLLLLMG